MSIVLTINNIFSYIELIFNGNNIFPRYYMASSIIYISTHRRKGRILEYFSYRLIHHRPHAFTISLSAYLLY